MTGASLVVVAALVAAVLTWTARPAETARPTARVTAAPVAPVVAIAVLVAAGRGLVVPALVAAAAGWAGWTLWQRRRRRRAEQAVAERVREACEQLAAELGAGRSPGDALQHVASTWPVLAPVAAAFEVGADVPAAIREVSAHPGAADLRLLAGAWQVSHRTGQGLASAVHRVTADLVATRRTRRIVEGELASARATARLVAALPFLAWGMGTGAGGSPISFLLGSPLGWACLAAGAGIGLAGLWWIEAIARDVDRTT